MRLDEAWLLDGLRSPLVLELKCENRMPMWMSALIRDLELDLLGYSKYGQGIEAMLRANRGADARLFDTSHYV